MNFVKGTLLLTMLLAFTAKAESTVPYSSASSAATKPQVVYHEYYTINEKTTQIGGPKAAYDLRDFSQFTEQIGPHQFIVMAAKKLVYNLLQWTLHNEDRPTPEEGYIRKLHFGRWINDPTDDTCMNTRAKVLVRDSLGEVTYRNERHCVVEDGLWDDPYTGDQVTSSRAIQIDHMVPLKNAYVSGAYQWDYKTRCLYANYMGYRNHLIPAGASQNMSKGDRGPEAYMPPNLEYRCQYIKDWLAVKFIWKLNMNANEAQAIHETFTNYGCRASDFRITKEQLEEQRQYINDNIEFCMINKR